MKIKLFGQLYEAKKVGDKIEYVSLNPEFLEFPEFITFEGEFDEATLAPGKSGSFETNRFQVSYEGEFEDGNLRGHAKITYTNGDFYEGEIFNTYRQGKGKCTYYNGDIYEGDFFNDCRQGRGKYLLNDGNVYEGQFRYNNLNGFAKATYPSGDRYEGQFHSGLNHGEGKYFYANGDVYKGDFYEGKMQGNGKYFHNGYVYEGEYFDNRQHGYGVLTYSDKTSYEGEFFQGQFHGFGAYNFAEGMVYEGDFENSSIHGKGEYRVGNNYPIKANFKHELIVSGVVKEKRDRKFILLSSTHKNAGMKHALGNYYKIDPEAIFLIDENSKEELEIAKFICERSGESKDKQVVITIFYHGKSDGTLDHQETGLEKLEEIFAAVKKHNSLGKAMGKATGIDLIKRVKINGLMCYGATFFDSAVFVDLAAKFIKETGVEIRVSGSENEGSLLLFNGKNAMDDLGKIVEMNFSKTPETANHWQAGKAEKYQDLRIIERSGIFIAQGAKIFEGGAKIDPASWDKFKNDIYVTPSEAVKAPESGFHCDAKFKQPAPKSGRST